MSARPNVRTSDPARRAFLRRTSTLLAALVLLAGAVLLYVSGPSPARAADATICDTTPLGTATGWTEFVQGNGRRGAESEGTVAYGGDLDAQWMTVGTRVASGHPTDATLIVNGTGGSFNLQQGSAYVRVLNGGLNLNGGTGTKRLATSPLDVASAFPDLKARAARWGALAATGTAQVVNSDTTETPAGGNVLLLKGLSTGLNVFRVTPAQLQGNRATYINVPAGSTALIDVVGTGAITIGGQVAYFDPASRSYAQSADGTTERNAHTLWNLPDATSVTLDTGAAFGGTLFAPSAAVTVSSTTGHTLGQVVAASFVSDRETHQHLFAGCLPGAVTTPPVTTTTAATPPVTTTTATTPPVTTTTTAAPPVTTTTTTPPVTTTTTAPPTTTTTTTTPPVTTTTTTTPPTTTTTPATPVDPGTAEIHVSKTVDASVVLPGTPVSFVLTAQNRGTAPAADVVLSDLVPVGLQGVTADAPCVVDGLVVRCAAGTLAAGASRSFVLHGIAAPLTAAPDPDDQFHPYDAQKDWQLAQGEQQTVALGCAGGILADGSVRIVDVDHSGTADRSLVHVLSQRVNAAGEFEAVIEYRGTGHAQGRLHVACLPAQTSSGHALVTGDAVTKTAVLDARTEPYPIVFDCGVGRTPIAASIDTPPGRARIVASVPDGTTRRVIRVRVDQDATQVTVGVRCLSSLTGPANGSTTQIGWRVISAPVTIAAGESAVPKLECGDQEKGLVGGWDLDPGLLPVGNEPQIKSRVFSIDNPSPTALSGTVYLLCVSERTSNAQGVVDLTNTVTGSSSSPQREAAVLSASAALRVQAAPAPAGQPTVAIDPPAATPIAAAAAPVSTVARLMVAAAAAVTPAPPTLRTATLKGSAVSVALRCTTACSGTVEVRAAARLRVAKRTYKASALLASKRFRVAAGHAATVRVTLPARLAKALKAQGVRKVRLTVKDAAGRRTTRVLKLGR